MTLSDPTKLEDSNDVPGRTVVASVHPGRENGDFWRGRRILITGHTGFKGSWLTQWLKVAGAVVSGFSLDPPTQPSLYEAANIGEGVESTIGDVRDLQALRDAMVRSRPEVVFHMAAQSLVRPSYADPVGTYATNVMGTVNLLESVRGNENVRAVVIVTSDKCYENRGWLWPYREQDPMGGHDPYSSSKGCAELVAAAYRRSYFVDPGAACLFSVRAGNVIGGGDWAKDRLVPDLLRAFGDRTPAMVRNPNATRPWQFVLDPLHGYLQLVQAAFEQQELPMAWNFGPAAEEVRPVHSIADQMVRVWGDGACWKQDDASHPHEAFTLTLDSSRARTLLRWKPAIDVDTALAWTIEWYKTWRHDPERAGAITTELIRRFISLSQAGVVPGES